MNTRPIPATREALPVVGCGTWIGFDVAAGSAVYQRHAGVLDALFAAGGTVLDSSPMYGRSEAVTGDLLVEMLRLAGGLLQVIDGDFEAYRLDETRPWLVVRAIDSSEYAVVTQDERLLARVRERFRDVRDSPDDAAYVA